MATQWHAWRWVLALAFCVVGWPGLAGTLGVWASEPAWPQIHGPHGNFTPPPSATPLVDDVRDARQVWLSQTDDLGYAKGSVSGFLQNLARWDGHPGSCSGPILAEGQLFVSTFRPAGTAWAENQPQLKNLDPSRLTEAEHARLRRNLRILADDLLVAIDAATGQTLWQAVETEAGLNRYMGKRQGYNVAPAWHSGTVFSLGTTGRLRAYSAHDGSKLWETSLGRAHDEALRLRDDVLAKRVLPGGMGWNTSLIVAQGVLIVPLFDGQDLGLRGVDVLTGASLWEIPQACSRHATPAVWSHQGRQYILAATVSGVLRLIDPVDGRVLWTVEGLGPNHFSLTPSAGYVFVNGGSARPRREGSSQHYGLLAGYALSLTGAERVWKHPEEPPYYFSTWMDNCARRFLAVADGKLYFRAHGLDNEPSQFHTLDQSTGQILASLPLASPALQFYPLGERLLMIRDGSHSQTELAMLDARPPEPRLLSDFWLPPHQNTTAYEVLMEHPLVAGHLYLRTRDGRIARYDLRRPG